MKVFVGLSGGVDSSVSAALLKEAGHEVTGVFIRGWYPENIPCTWREDRQDAMRVAAHLKIPFTTLDLEKEYKESVIDYLISEYKEGRTPNPDVLCNQDIKFGAFLAWAKEKGADKVATGHYAQVIEKNGTFSLRQGKDSKKDQSYFLYTLTQKELAHVFFPVGGFEKSKTRDLAKKYALPVATKPDSQGLCFIGHVDIPTFLKQYIEIVPGNVKAVDGTIVGKHEGAVVYTLGQRHGFTLTKPQKEPLYVVARDIEENTITVAPQSQQEHWATKTVALSSLTWTNDSPKNFDGVTAQYRYHGPHLPIAAMQDNTVTFAENVPEPLSAGQALVLYRGEECLGGGNIVY